VTGEAFYFGCWRQAGHYFWSPGMVDRHCIPGPPTPWGYGVESLTPTTTNQQGAAALHHRAGWTALAVHDYTVDRRGNSKSVFCFKGELTFEQAVGKAHQLFPGVMARLAGGGIFDPARVCHHTVAEGCTGHGDF
jgi:hypothetical protein